MKSRLCRTIILLIFLCLPAGALEPDLDLLRECRDDSIPFDLFATYSRFVTALGRNQAAELAGFCDTNRVVITTDRRPAGKETTGDTINLPFMQAGFRKHLIEIHLRSKTEYLLRTASSSLLFSQQKDQTWQLIQYRDEPMVPAPVMPDAEKADPPATPP